MWAIGGWSLGVLMCLGVVVGVGSISPERQQARVDRCVATAVRTYPNLGGRELKVKELADCKGLTDQELNEVRQDLQEFGVEAATRVAQGGE
jgi:hypothetical protein